MSRLFAFTSALLLVGCTTPSRDNPGTAVDMNSDLTKPGNSNPDLAPDTSGLDVEPSDLQTITVSVGAMTPTAPTSAPYYVATRYGTPVNVRWSVDRGDVGTVDTGQVSQTTLTPRGTTGGLVTVLASYNGIIIKRQVLVKLSAAAQNGASTTIASEIAQVPTTVGALSTGGGVGGVGGEGLGPMVSDANALTALGAPTSNGSTQHLMFLYPYDKTIWPRGLLAPLLMWRWDTGDADAIKIELSTTSGSFTWTGTFAKPAILSQTSGSFVRHPIPQDIWDMASNSAGGLAPDGTADKVTVKLTIAKSGVGYGPITETWNIAPGRLTGTTYYTSYATHLVPGSDSGVSDGGGHTLEAGVLSIRSGDTSPQPAAGSTRCSACHTVSARGNTLIAQGKSSYWNPSTPQSYFYDLTSAATESSIPQMGVFEFAAMTQDGSYALANVVDGSCGGPALNNSCAGTATSTFWQFGVTPTQVTLSGLPSGVAAGYPTFSPDDRYLAYVDVTGHSDLAVASAPYPLTIALYDSTNHVFSAWSHVFTPANSQRIGFLAFLPDNSGVIFHNEVRVPSAADTLGTMNGARATLWWSTLSGTAVALDTANGNGYLPTAANNHGIAGASDPGDSYSETGWDDSTLAYEPTVLPVAVGGYAWVVFTSRRMYGNQLTSVPWISARQYDTTDPTKGSVKKLWVAAINLNATGGMDPSHPAFYLPAQELLAENSRGYWALDPCHGEGDSCATGDQCCGGCCQPNGTGGALICQNPPPDGHCDSTGACSGVQEKCATAADCCDASNQCINGFCAITIQ